MKRDRPIRQDIQEASTCRELQKLYTEVVSLLKSTIDCDRRSLRDGCGEKKRKHQARQNLYCQLYREVRDRFIIVKKQTKDNGQYSKEPLELSDFLIKHSWYKTVKYSESTNINNNLNLEQIYKQIMEKKYFNRNDEVTKKSALKDTLLEFLSKHSGQTSEEVLKQAYNEIRSKNLNKTVEEVIEDRVGVDESDEVLAVLSEQGEELTEQEPTTTENSIPEPTTSSEVEEVIDSNEPEKIFKTLPSETKLLLVESCYNELGGGDIKTGPIKKLLQSRGYVINHYDEVYFIYEKFIKSKK